MNPKPPVIKTLFKTVTSKFSLTFKGAIGGLTGKDFSGWNEFHLLMMSSYGLLWKTLMTNSCGVNVAFNQI